MTNLEYYQGSNYCLNNQYNKHATECNYYYKYVSFKVTIPLNEFKSNHKYRFYLYDYATRANVKMYAPLYVDNFEQTINFGKQQYHIHSEMNKTKLKTNTNAVFVRAKPGKNGTLYKKNKEKYYYKIKQIYHYYGSEKINNVTWYKVGIKPTSESFKNVKLVKPGYNTKTWISSPFVDYNGSGYINLEVNELVDSKIVNGYSEVLSKNHGNTSVDVEFTTTNPNAKASIKLQYGDKEQIKIISPKIGIQNIKFHIPNAQISKNKKLKYTINPVDSSYQEENPNNNKLIFKTLYPTNKKVVINKTPDKKGKLNYTYKTVSGIKVTQNGVRQNSYETIKINTTTMLKDVNSELINYDANFSGMYAGGAFIVPVEINYKNDYFQSSYQFQKDEVLIKFSTKNIIDIDSNQDTIEYKYSKGKYIFPLIYINDAGKISHRKLSDAIYPKGKSVLYTKTNLKPNKYSYKINIYKIGANQLEFEIPGTINIIGSIIGEQKKDLFYFRNINRINPMPLYQSELWSNYQTQLIDAINDKQGYHEISIDKKAIRMVKDFIYEDYQGRINNNKEFEIFYDDLVQKKLIKE